MGTKTKFVFELTIETDSTTEAEALVRAYARAGREAIEKEAYRVEVRRVESPLGRLSTDEN